MSSATTDGSGQHRDEGLLQPSVEQLRPVDLFDDLSDEEVAEFASVAYLREVKAGEIVSSRDSHPSTLTLLLKGRLELNTLGADGREEPAGEQVAPTWIGAIAILTGGTSVVQMRASTDLVVASIPAAEFLDLMLSHRPVFDRVMSRVAPVVSRLTAREQNRERLASLGTMAAGLAHELNNPASAARRAASDLQETLEVLSQTVARFVDSGIDHGQATKLVELQRRAIAERAGRTSLDALDAADAEDEMSDALEEMGVAEAWRLAEPLAGAGLGTDWLREVNDNAGSATGAALQWVAASLNAQELVNELAESTERMSSLVSAIKSYAYLDRGELVEVDIHEGLETTLTVLGHKLKHTGIEVKRNYDRSLPKLTVHAGELNQVWTNLLDNAIDALGENGRITISTVRDGVCARIDIADDGPGIEPGARSHVFDPFFTTKDVGKGTGLGLDTARRIIADRHRGSIDVDSQPGATVFHVWLPLTVPAR